ncbi:Kinesin-like protein like protein [Aduncisulcus paluster]|uniref:Kinesin-like protein like protein n=1 Tax=Aduncisulcus paluster TaxID=2918883 RepID=A0ABQ5KQN5_9EUKA|nr:Kinesin-like protein like protein [Aduncisulcus paluster]
MTKIYSVIRLKPLKPDEESCLSYVDSHTALFQPSKEEETNFTFDRVFGEEASQEDVFSSLEHLIQGVLKGRDCCILAYGLTGSGKTHTISGSYLKEKEGLLPRSIRYLLKRSHQDGEKSHSSDDSESDSDDTIDSPTSHFVDLDSADKEFSTPTVFPSSPKTPLTRNPGVLLSPCPAFPMDSLSLTISVVELYNKQVYDLLDPKLSTVKLHYAWQDDDKVTKETVSRISEALRCIAKANRNRRTAHTNANITSSRSHCIYKLVLKSHDNEVGCLTFVDLAGSENADAAITPKQQSEGNNIRFDLLFLQKVLRNLRNKKLIGLRDSILTKTLAAYFDPRAKPGSQSYIYGKPKGGSDHAHKKKHSCKVCICVTIHPELKSHKQILNTLKFAKSNNQIDLDRIAKATPRYLACAPSELSVRSDMIPGTPTMMHDSRAPPRTPTSNGLIQSTLTPFSHLKHTQALLSSPSVSLSHFKNLLLECGVEIVHPFTSNNPTKAISDGTTSSSSSGLRSHFDSGLRSFDSKKEEECTTTKQTDSLKDTEDGSVLLLVKRADIDGMDRELNRLKAEVEEKELEVALERDRVSRLGEKWLAQVREEREKGVELFRLSEEHDTLERTMLEEWHEGEKQRIERRYTTYCKIVESREKRAIKEKEEWMKNAHDLNLIVKKKEEELSHIKAHFEKLLDSKIEQLGTCQERERKLLVTVDETKEALVHSKLENNRLKNDVSQLKTLIDIEKEEKEQVKYENSGLLDSLSMIKKEHDQFSVEIQELRRALEIAKKDNEILDSDLGKVKQSLEITIKEKDALKLDLEKKENNLEQTRSALEKIQEIQREKKRKKKRRKREEEEEEEEEVIEIFSTPKLGKRAQLPPTPSTTARDDMERNIRSKRTSILKKKQEEEEKRKKKEEEKKEKEKKEKEKKKQEEERKRKKKEKEEEEERKRKEEEEERKRKEEAEKKKKEEEKKKKKKKEEEAKKKKSVAKKPPRGKGRRRKHDEEEYVPDKEEDEEEEEEEKEEKQSRIGRGRRGRRSSVDSSEDERVSGPSTYRRSARLRKMADFNYFT